MLQNLINHITMVVDSSGSMYRLTNKLVEVFDREIKTLKNRSIELDQETRLSIYTFNGSLTNLCFDMDVMRMKSLKDYYMASGSTGYF